MVSPTTSLPNKGECIIIWWEIFYLCSFIVLVFPLQVLRESVDNYRRGHPVPACQIQLAWTNVEEPPKELFYLIHVTGVLHLDTHIAVTRPGQQTPCCMHIYGYGELHSIYRLHIQVIYTFPKSTYMLKVCAISAE